MDIRELIIEASEAYYRGEPIMTDAEFDELADKYYAENPDDRIIGYHPDRDRARELPIPMFSLTKEKEIDRIYSWLEKHGCRHEQLIITPKLDGISLCVDEFQSPSRRMASTRGDGCVGQNCDVHYAYMNGGDNDDDIPVWTFGEAIMSKEAFKKYDEANGGRYKNARNLVGSQLNASRPVTSILEDIDYIRYGMTPIDGSGQYEYRYRSDEIDYLNKLNGVSMKYCVVDANAINHNMMMELYNEWCGDYEIDGLVIEVNDRKTAEVMGREVNMNPAFARAYKGHFDQRELTCVERIRYQVSKHGKLKPVADIETVRLSGVDVSKASAYNAKNVLEKRIGAGAIVSVVRSGAVIPKIAEVHNGSDPDLPERCPSCCHRVEWDENKVDLVCDNSLCPEMQISKMVAFFSILKCKNVGRGVIEAIYKNLHVHTVEGVLGLQIHDIASMPKYGERKAEKICGSIEECVTGVEEEQIMHASSCFEGIGADTIRDIRDGSNTGEADNAAYKKGLEDYNHFREGIRDFIKLSGIDTQKTTKLAHVNAVFTGFRDESLEKDIKNNGGRVSGSVSSKTTHLVIASRGSGTSKEQKALELGKVIMERDEFQDYIAGFLNG